MSSRFLSRRPLKALYRWCITDGASDIKVADEWMPSIVTCYGYGQMWLDNCSLPVEVKWRYYLVIDIYLH
jgi:hypothetical protein